MGGSEIYRPHSRNCCNRAGIAAEVDSGNYQALLEKNIPIIFYYGDYMGEEYTDIPAAAMWAGMASTADVFTEAYNAAGENSTIVRLPEERIWK